MRRTALAVAMASFLWLVPGVALAAWGASAYGTGSARAETMPSVVPPTGSVAGRDVTVSWPASAFSSGEPVGGYLVRRYDALGGTPRVVGAACDGVVAATTCTEALVPAGQWIYTVTPVHDGWTGIESGPSAAFSVASPGLVLAPSTITSLPAILTGGLTGFAAGESVIFRLDDPATGAVLAGAITPDPVPAGGEAAVSVTLPGGTAIGPHTIYAVGSLGTVGAAAASVSDGTAPVVSAAVVGKTQGGTPGFVKQGGTYFVYASVADLANPATGVASVTADVSALTTGQTAVVLSTGSWTVAGVTYNYRSASLTAANPLTEGARAFSIRAQDVAGNAVTQSGFSVSVDKTRPSAADVQTANASGGTVGRPEAGDTMTLTFTEPLEPGSILAGWTGAATSVTVRLVNNGAGDRLQVRNAASGTQLPFGTIVLGRTDYVTATRNLTGSSMMISGSTIVVTLGTPSGAVGTALGAGTISWTPSITPYDRAANACLNTVRTETGGADPEF